MSPLRPLSPYFGVYKLRLNSIMSFLHRVTGVFLYVGLICFMWSFISSVFFPEFSAFSSRGVSPFLHFFMVAFRFVWAVCFCYHFLNGIRHMIWDMGVGFSATGYRAGLFAVILLFSALLIVLCFFV